MARRLPSSYHPSLTELENSIDCASTSIPLVKPNPWVRSSARWMLLLFGGMVCGLMLTPWQQTSVGFGTVVPYLPSERLQSINAPITGVISKWDVVEGDFVKKGDPVVEMADIDSRLMERLENQIEAAQTAVDAANIAVQTSQKNLRRQKQLSEKGLKSQRDYEKAQLEYQKLLAELAEKRKALTEIQVTRSRQASQVITAPRSGTIMRILVPESDAIITAGKTLASLAPETAQRVVELFIPGNDLPLIQKDRKVRLQFEGWPALQFSGWPNAALGTYGGIVINIDPSDNGKGQFRILVAPDKTDEPWPPNEFLRQGVRAKGWVLLETVSSGYELWRKFNGFPPVIKSPQHSENIVSDKNNAGPLI
jgi:multidrug efflux pump subunit AcrA (membrane-fusion protein)